MQISHGSPGGPLVGSYREIQRNQSAYERIYLSEAMDMMRHGKMDEAITKLSDLGFTYGEIKSEILRYKSGEASFMKNFDATIKKMYRKATPSQKKRLDELMAK